MKIKLIALNFALLICFSVASVAQDIDYLDSPKAEEFFQFTRKKQNLIDYLQYKGWHDEVDPQYWDFPKQDGLNYFFLGRLVCHTNEAEFRFSDSYVFIAYQDSQNNVLKKMKSKLRDEYKNIVSRISFKSFINGGGKEMIKQFENKVNQLIPNASSTFSVQWFGEVRY